MITEFFSNHLLLQFCLIGGIFVLPAVMEVLIRSRIMIANEMIDDEWEKRKQKKRLKKYDKVIAVLFYWWLGLLFIVGVCLAEWLFRLIF